MCDKPFEIPLGEGELQFEYSVGEHGGTADEQIKDNTSGGGGVGEIPRRDKLPLP